MQEYNVKKRIFPNGLCQVRVFKKGVVLGLPRDGPNKDSFEMLEVPFEDEPVRSSRFNDAEGFSVSVERDKDLVIAKSMKRTRDKVYDYSNSNNWEWFCTFTFNPDKVDRSDFGQVSKKFSKWLENMRRLHCPDMKYLVVPEKHKDGSYHFHGLFSECDGLKFVMAINQQEFLKNGKPNKYYKQLLIRKGVQVYDIKRFKLGFSDCTKVRDTKKVASYILKYITKDMIADVANRKRYWVSRNLELPKEECYCVPILDYEEFCNDLVGTVAVNNPDVYVTDCTLQHGEYDNMITYLTYDSSKGDLEFDYNLFQERNDSGRSCSDGTNAIDEFLNNNN